MKILHRFMLKQFIGPFVMVFVVVVFTLLMQFLWKYIDELVGKGLELSVIAELLLYTSANLAIMAFPLAVLLSSIFTLGNLGENYELIALKAAGISLQRIVFPLIILSFFIAIGAFLFANNVTPVANLKMSTLLHDIRKQKPELSIREQIFFNGIDGYSIRVGRKNYKTGQLYDLMIYDHTKKQGNMEVILADSGNMVVTADKRFMEVTLYHGHNYVDVVNRETVNSRNKTYPFQHRFFDKQVFRMELPGFGLDRSDGELYKQSYQAMSLMQLNYMIDSLTILTNQQEGQLRRMVKPAYQIPDRAIQKIDTTLRSKIPDDFMVKFNEQTKSKRQTSIQEAINSARNQKDQLSGVIYELDFRNKSNWRYEVEWHRKFTMSLACLIFFFIGAPLGAIIRKGGLGTPIIIAVLFFVIYYVISMIGEKSAKSGTMTPLWGMWLSTIIVLPIGIFLTYLATRDSSIFNQDLYLSYIKRALSFIFVTHRTQRPDIKYKASETELDPVNMIAQLEELSHRCNLFLDGDFRKIMKFRKIWHTQNDTDLVDIANRYDHIKAILKQSDVEIIHETVAEYPKVALHQYKIQMTSKWQAIASAVVFPIWIYLYLKAWIQKYSLRNELRSIIGANRNLVNELNSVL